MKILVVGSGGREHTIIKKLRENKSIEHIYALPGNGGIAQDAECVPIKANDIAAIMDFAVENSVDFAVVAPDDPLVLGAVDMLHAAGIPCFGPEAKAALIEGSKSFAKDLMKKYHIPTAAYEVFTDYEHVCDYLSTCSYPVVIKADGLALGKGVVIAADRVEAEAAAKSMLLDKKFGASGDTLVIEEFLTGPEISVLAFTDGHCVVPMVSSMDHKRVGNNDTGLNTGGMGTIAPNPCYTPDLAEQCMQKIFLPTIRGMATEGRMFKGCLYFGLMLTTDGPKVIEYNCRFGDPEAQVVLPLLKSDLFDIMRAVEEERLHEQAVCFHDGAACCVIMASDGYPATYQTGYPVHFGSATAADNIAIFHAGTKLDQSGELVTSGGRVLGVTAVADTLIHAIEQAYTAVKDVHFSNAYCRNDIGQKALTLLKKE